MTMRLCLAGIVIAGWAASAHAAPQTFNTALPVAEGEFVLREQVIFDQSGDAMGDDPGFSGSGAGQNQQRSAGVFDGLPLGRVQSGFFPRRIIILSSVFQH